jgi:hypothetical protein
MKLNPKSKPSTQKKCEETFSEGVGKIKDSQENKENDISLRSTPYKEKSPSKANLKSVKEDSRTPFSRIEDKSLDIFKSPVDARYRTKSITNPFNQPNFNTENKEESKSSYSTKFRSRTKSALLEFKYKKLNINMMIKIF